MIQNSARLCVQPMFPGRHNAEIIGTRQRSSSSIVRTMSRQPSMRACCAVECQAVGSDAGFPTLTRTKHRVIVADKGDAANPWSLGRSGVQ